MMFKAISLLAALLCIAEARPGIDVYSVAVDIDLAIIGGTNAQPGAWPWQLSQQRLRATGEFRHSCGASLLSSRYALSAAHCVDNRPPSDLRIIAGQYDRADYTDTQTTNVASYTIHEQYNTGGASYSNDIAIITFETAIVVGGNVQLARLPADNSNDFTGANCVITGWGRDSTSQELPNILQQANITPLSLDDCRTRVRATSVWDKQVCVYDSSNTSGACNGDSGGPLNCPSGEGYVVAGVASWVIANEGNCNVNYPSVYTRASSYLDWIATNTP